MFKAEAVHDQENETRYRYYLTSYGKRINVRAIGLLFPEKTGFGDQHASGQGPDLGTLFPIAKMTASLDRLFSPFVLLSRSIPVSVCVRSTKGRLRVALLICIMGDQRPVLRLPPRGVLDLESKSLSNIEASTQIMTRGGKESFGAVYTLFLQPSDTVRSQERFGQRRPLYAFYLLAQ